jgi:hypothetical protein
MKVLVLLSMLTACSQPEASKSGTITHSATLHELRIHNGTAEAICVPATALEVSTGSIKPYRGADRLAQDTFAELTVGDLLRTTYFVAPPQSDAAFQVNLDGVRGVPTRIEYSVPVVGCAQIGRPDQIRYLNSNHRGISSEPMDQE